MKNKHILLSFLALVAIWGCGSKAQPNAASNEEIPSVAVATIQSEELSDQIIASGLLASKTEIKLAFKTGGMIRKIYVQEGQSVKQGQLLAELDLSEIDAQVNQAKLGLQKALRDYDRVKKLFADEAATETNLSDAKTGLDVANQTVIAASFNQKLSKIYAPTAGKILRKISEQGELVTPFSPIFILGGGNGAFVVNLGLTDKQIVKTKIGNPVNVTFDAYPGENFKGTISQIAQTVNPMTGTFEVEVTLAPNSKQLISGFVAKANINPTGSKSSLMIPIEALAEADENKGVVFVFEQGKAMRRDIEIGAINGELVELKSGLALNEKVITKGGGFLSDGQKVIVRP